MKDQYFGDINDYRKYGLLRALQASGDGSLLVAWMLTPDDGGPDGRFRAYIEAPDTWAPYDRDLFEGLRRLLCSAPQPAVSLLEGSGLLPRACYHSVVVPDGRQEREAWRRDLVRAASDVDLVFLDPDNGIEVPSKPVGRKGSLEVRYLARDRRTLGSRLLDPDIPALPTRAAGVVRRANGVGATRPYWRCFHGGLCTPRVLFLLAAQERHKEWFREAVSLVPQRWNGQIASMGPG